MLKKTFNGIAAGILISLGGGIFLACLPENKIVGAVLFAVALLSICLKGYSLYTGKICYIPLTYDKEAFSVLLLGLLGNLIGTVVCGYMMRYGIPSMGETAFAICSAKLEQTFLQTLIRGIFCGILIYLAVDIYKTKNNIVGIIFCIPVFILSGFEHSIADIYYFSVSGIVSIKAFAFLWTVILGNTIGGILLPLFSLIGAKNEE